MGIEKIFCNKETIAALNYEMQQQMSFIFPSMQNKIINPILNQGSKPIIIKWMDFSQWLNPYKEDCFSIV